MEEFIKFPKITRLSKETITITEKIDGTNGQIHVWQDDHGIRYIKAAGRNRWLTKEDHNFHFYDFVMDNAVELIEELGEGRHYGEWYGQGINRNYGLKEKRFALFNTNRWNNENKPSCCEVIPTLEITTMRSFNENYYLNRLRDNGSQAVPGFMKPEGIMIYLHNLGKYYKVLLEDDDKHKGEL
jgi:hypothetical protein